MSFSVLLSRPEQLQPDKIASLLAAFHKVPSLDARRLAKHGWGFLAERLEETRARLLAAQAAQAGVGTLLLEEKEVVSLPPPQNVHMARCAPEGFCFATGSDSTEKCAAWDRVRLLAAVGLREEVSLTKTVKEGPTQGQKLASLGITLATGISVRLGGKGKEVRKAVKETEFFMYMDLFTAEPAEGQPGQERLSRLHVNAQAFNFASLGPRKAAGVFANFRTLLQDVAQAAGNIISNKGAKMILSGQPLSPSPYDSQEDYEKECRWLLTLVRR